MQWHGRTWRRTRRTTIALAVSVGVLAACGAGGVTGIDRTDGLQVLFIGNSLTYANDLPGILLALLDSAGARGATVSSVALANFGLEDHWAEGSALAAIRSGGWDVVVLQQGPSATEGRPSLLDYAARFATEITAVGARPALYMVWPARDRSFDFDGVSDSYATAAREVDGLLFPAGEAWREAWRRDPSLALYGEDGFHPSPAGSYLAALVMVQQLTGKDPRGLPAHLTPRSPVDPEVNLDPQVARLLQEAAAEANRRFARP
jgi:hypothetical protein